MWGGGLAIDEHSRKQMMFLSACATFPQGSATLCPPPHHQENPFSLSWGVAEDVFWLCPLVCVIMTPTAQSVYLCARFPSVVFCKTPRVPSGPSTLQPPSASLCTALSSLSVKIPIGLGLVGPAGHPCPDSGAPASCDAESTPGLYWGPAPPAPADSSHTCAFPETATSHKRQAGFQFPLGWPWHPRGPQGCCFGLSFLLALFRLFPLLRLGLLWLFFSPLHGKLVPFFQTPRRPGQLWRLPRKGPGSGSPFAGHPTPTLGFLGWPRL